MTSIAFPISADDMHMRKFCRKIGSEGIIASGPFAQYMTLFPQCLEHSGNASLLLFHVRMDVEVECG